MNSAPPPQKSLKEPLLAFALALVAIFAATALASAWPPLSNHLVTIAACCFVGIPYFILSRRGEDFHRFGIALDEIPRQQVLFGLAITALIFPLFAAGNHLWETKFLERQLFFSVDNLRQWPMELEAPPLFDEIDDDFSAVQIRTTHNQLHISFLSRDDGQPRLTLEGDRPFSLIASGPLLAEAKDGPPSTSWQLEPTAKNRLARVSLSAIDQEQIPPLPRELSIQVEPTDEVALLAGSQLQSPAEPLKLKRSYWWILLWSLTHLILVALPEEYFYRGYLQTRLTDFFDGGDEEPARFLGFSRANWATSALFAVGHVLIPIGGAFLISRTAVFFPSLIFGWMRERTQSIIAPTIFHAGANMMVLLVTIHYF